MPTSVFPTQVAHDLKRQAGRTDTEKTPVNIRSSQPLGDFFKGYVRQRTSSKLRKFSRYMERTTIRFEDVNGPKGGVDINCRIKVVVTGLPSVVVNERAVEPRQAFDLAIDATERSLRRSLEKRGKSGGKKKSRPKGQAMGSGLVNPTPETGSLIGRRVGRSKKALQAAVARPEKTKRDAYVDTALPGVNASFRKAGGGSTARRNTLGTAPKATFTLEDSAQGEPSRLSTRKSANRIKNDANLTRREIRRVRSPKARAVKAQASGIKAKGG